jgi:4-hydroxy-tetrahydrodipicolinate reductase
LKIALIGYGKMGKAIEQIAIAKGHIIVAKYSSQNIADLKLLGSTGADVAIEFTNPQSAVNNLLTCFDAKVPVVCGSTGWENSLQEVERICTEKKGALLHASNFSIGVNIFFEVNKKLAALMDAQKQYEVSIKEIHHTQKKDAPSGTAISLANQIVAEQKDKTGWATNAETGKVVIESLRQNPAPGTHFVKYASSIDEIEIIHTAHSREGFASGAVLAAEFLTGKVGLFTMKDVLKII